MHGLGSALGKIDLMGNCRQDVEYFSS